MQVSKSLMTKKGKEEEQTLAKLGSAHCHLQAKCQLVQSSCIKQIKLFLCRIINILLTKLSWSVWENLDLSRVYMCS